MRMRDRAKHAPPSPPSSTLSSPPLSPLPDHDSEQLSPGAFSTTIQRSHIIRLPLPEFLGGPEHTAPPSPTIPTCDRAFWAKTLGPLGNRGITMGAVVTSLGLRSTDLNSRQFLAPEVTTLAKEAKKFAVKLPATTDQLIDAACGDTLKAEIDSALNWLGPRIWGRGKHRPWLLRAREVAGYEKDLYIENDRDRALITLHYRTWIFLKGANMIHNCSMSKGNPDRPRRTNFPKDEAVSITAMIAPEVSLVGLSAQTKSKSSKRRRVVLTAKDRSLSLTAPPRAPQVNTEQRGESSKLVPLPMGTTPYKMVQSPANSTVVDPETSSQNLLAPAADFYIEHAPRLPLPWNRHWTEEEWLCASTIAPDVKFEFWIYLGFPANPLYKIPIRTEILVIGKRIATQLTTEECCKCATSTSYLNQEIDILLDEFAPVYWSFDAPGRIIVEKDENGRRRGPNLIYEDDADRQMLWLHLHQLIFLDALATLAYYDEFGAKCQDADAKNLAKLAERKKCVVPLRDFAPLPAESEPEPNQDSTPETPISLDMPDAPDKGKGKANTATEVPVATPNEPMQAEHVAHDNPDTPQPAQPRLTRSSSTSTSPFVASMLRYLHNYDDPTFKEDAGLSEIKYNLLTLPPTSPLLATNFPTILRTWLQYRNKLMSIRHTVSTRGFIHPRTQLEHMDRLFVDLRKARMAFYESAGDAWQVAETVLVEGFIAMAKTGEEQGLVKEEIERGMGRLGKDVRRLEELLGGGKWAGKG